MRQTTECCLPRLIFSVKLSYERLGFGRNNPLDNVLQGIVLEDIVYPKLTAAYAVYEILLRIAADKVDHVENKQSYHTGYRHHKHRAEKSVYDFHYGVFRFDNSLYYIDYNYPYNLHDYKDCNRKNNLFDAYIYKEVDDSVIGVLHHG